MNRQILNAQLREKYLSEIRNALAAEDLQLIASNKVAFPVVDSEGNDKWIVLTVTVPTDEEFDGYNDAVVYKEKVALKAEKAERAKALKEAKIKRDAALRAKNK